MNQHIHDIAGAAPLAPTNRLLLKPPAAAEVLSISLRSLHAASAPRGPIPIIRIGKRGVRYDLEDLKAHIASQRRTGGAS